MQVYPATKSAIATWARRTASSPDWIGAGIRVNAIAPGLIDGGTDAIMDPHHPPQQP